ncbi:Uncharacterized protein FWK35_00025362 [Aphis craccivora]|uniref:Uncharacterized protein n=1 Tax=Aphis craccivora TaxID=307492 RepID=A0A6G0Y0V5_APHCR|nr:Uncharacterized protein FWK35_00025362 [Aphis craccivora]
MYDIDELGHGPHGGKNNLRGGVPAQNNIRGTDLGASLATTEDNQTSWHHSKSPLLAITSCYKTSSTNCLSAIAGTLPLDLKVRRFRREGKTPQ